MLAPVHCAEPAFIIRDVSAVTYSGGYLIGYCVGYKQHGIGVFGILHVLDRMKQNSLLLLQFVYHCCNISLAHLSFLCCIISLVIVTTYLGASACAIYGGVTELPTKLSSSDPIPSTNSSNFVFIPYPFYLCPLRKSPT